MIKTEALLEKLFENTKSILLVTDEKFFIRYISSSVESSFGLQAYSVLGRNAFDFVSESNREDWRKCLEEANGNWRKNSCKTCLALTGSLSNIISKGPPICSLIHCG